MFMSASSCRTNQNYDANMAMYIFEDISRSDCSVDLFAWYFLFLDNFFYSFHLTKLKS